MELTIKPCCPEDIDDLVLISRETFAAAFEAQNNPEDFEHYLNTALSKERLLTELNNALSHFYFVYLKNALVGFYKVNEGEAQTDLLDPQALELERIYILTEYQNKGIGSCILEDVVNKARKAMKDYIWLGVWEKNLRAIAFYESQRFIKFGRHPYYIGKDRQIDWLMRLDLSTL